jgi:hypothetical protein
MFTTPTTVVTEMIFAHNEKATKTAYLHGIKKL